MEEQKPLGYRQYRNLDLLGHHYRVTKEVWTDLTTLCGMEETLDKLDPEKDQWLYELGKERCDVLFTEIREELQRQAEFGLQHCGKCSRATQEYCLLDMKAGRPALCHCPR